MKIKKDVFLMNMEVHNYKDFTKISKVMDISRTHLWEVLEGRKNPGGKFLVGLKIAFPDVEIETILEI